MGSHAVVLFDCHLIDLIFECDIQVVLVKLWKVKIIINDKVPETK